MARVFDFQKYYFRWYYLFDQRGISGLKDDLLEQIKDMGLHHVFLDDLLPNPNEDSCAFFEVIRSW
jgi:hypothetical protein